MPALALFQDQLDDVPINETSQGFVGADGAQKPTLLTPDMIRRGENVWMDVDGLVRTRPGLRLVALPNTLPITNASTRTQGAAYFDTLACERILTVRNGRLYEVLSAEAGATVNLLAGPTPSDTAPVNFAQLIDRMFYTEGVLRWAYYAGAWSHGSVTTFSDASAMPTWQHLCAHGFRLLACEPGGYKIYASAIGSAHTATDWVKTQNIAIGTGEGDPLKKLISGQSGYLIALNERSIYQIETTDANVANWSSRKITDLTGCVEGATALQIGQNVYFLSRYGVTSLGQLADTISLNPAATLSAPMQAYIDRINWSAISTAWATAWRDLYVLALPLDSDARPTIFLTYNTRTGRWGTPWQCTLPDADLGGGVPAGFTGWTTGVITRFASKQETLIADSCGRLLRLDDAYEKDDRTAGTTQEITSWVTLRSHFFEFEEAYKQPFWLEVDWFNSTGAAVQINVVRDGLKAYPEKSLGSCEIVASGIATNNLHTFPISFPFMFQANETYRKSWMLRPFARFREAAIQIVCQQGRMKLRSVRVAAFVDTAELTA